MFLWFLMQCSLSMIVQIVLHTLISSLCATIYKVLSHLLVCTVSFQMLIMLCQSGVGQGSCT